MGDWLFLHSLHGPPFNQITACITKIQNNTNKSWACSISKTWGSQDFFFSYSTDTIKYWSLHRGVRFLEFWRKKTKHVVRPTAWRPLSGQLLCPPWGERTSPFRGRVRVAIACEGWLELPIVYIGFFLCICLKNFIFSEWCDSKRTSFLRDLTNDHLYLFYVSLYILGDFVVHLHKVCKGAKIRNPVGQW